MALTVSDCLKCGALRNAVVIAGKSGLDRIVESVTMLEFDGFEIEGLGMTSLRGNEMAVSSFANFIGKPEQLLRMVEQFQAAGLSCLVVFYLGVVMKELPKSLIMLCDKVNIPLIIMPSDLHYAYVDVVMPVAEAIISDKRSDSMFVSDILHTLICMDDDQQNIHSLLELLRLRTQSDLILTDTMLRPLDWSLNETSNSPTEFLEGVKAVLRDKLPLNPSTMLIDSASGPVELRFQPIRTNKLAGMLLAVNRLEQNFDIDALTQASEVLKLFLRVWRLTHSRLCELDALLQGGTAGTWERKIKKLIVIRNTNGASLDRIDNEPAMVSMLESDRLFAVSADQQVTYFSGSIVIAKLKDNYDIPALLHEVKNRLSIQGPLCAGVCTVVAGDSVQRIHSMIVNSLPIACKVFRGTYVFNEEKITFADEILKLKLQFGINADAILGILAPLMSDDRWEKYKLTLETLYLDCDGSVSDAAAHLGLHINTLKYRLRIISELLGQDVLCALCCSRVVLALAFLRTM